jgi:hypothetical protein
MAMLPGVGASLVLALHGINADVAHALTMGRCCLRRHWPAGHVVLRVTGFLLLYC